MYHHYGHSFINNLCLLSDVWFNNQSLNHFEQWLYSHIYSLRVEINFSKALIGFPVKSIFPFRKQLKIISFVLVCRLVRFFLAFIYQFYCVEPNQLLKSSFWFPGSIDLISFLFVNLSIVYISWSVSLLCYFSFKNYLFQ